MSRPRNAPNDVAGDAGSLAAAGTLRSHTHESLDARDAPSRRSPIPSVPPRGRACPPAPGSAERSPGSISSIGVMPAIGSLLKAHVEHTAPRSRPSRYTGLLAHPLKDARLLERVPLGPRDDEVPPARSRGRRPESPCRTRRWWCRRQTVFPMHRSPAAISSSGTKRVLSRVSAGAPSPTLQEEAVTTTAEPHKGRALLMGVLCRTSHHRPGRGAGSRRSSLHHRPPLCQGCPPAPGRPTESRFRSALPPGR